MSLDAGLLTLRIVIALSLYVFLGAIFVLMWRDVQFASEQQTSGKRAPARLVVVESHEAVPIEVGRTFNLRPHTIIGRGPTNNIVIPDTFASTEHAHIMMRNGQWWLDDQQSRNGTTVNDFPVTQPVVLSADDVIGIGRVQFRFELDGG